MKISELKKILTQNGCYLLNEGTRHEHWYSPITQQRFMIPRHNSKEIPKGTYQAIKKQAGLK